MAPARYIVGGACAFAFIALIHHYRAEEDADAAAHPLREGLPESSHVAYPSKSPVSPADSGADLSLQTSPEVGNEGPRPDTSSDAEEAQVVAGDSPLPPYLSGNARKVPLNSLGCETDYNVLFRMQSEGVDREWAKKSEKLLREFWQRSGHDGADPALSIQCRTTVCHLSYVTPLENQQHHFGEFSRSFSGFDQSPLAEVFYNPQHGFGHNAAGEGNIVNYVVLRRIGSAPPDEAAECRARSSKEGKSHVATE